MSTETKEPMVTMSIAQFAAKHGLVKVEPSVMVNTNSYPYVMFKDSNDQINCVYFSKRAATAVAEGTPVTKELLKEHKIGITTNAQGEERVKLITGAESLDLADLLS